MNMYAGQQVDIFACIAFAIMCAWTSRSGCMNIIISLQWILNISSLWLVFEISWFFIWTCHVWLFFILPAIYHLLTSSDISTWQIF
jgi:hypothetical protein